MNISEKLILQQQLGGVVLFREGIFLRAYNESAYILTKLLYQDLKILNYQSKPQHIKQILMCAFPYVKLAERLPNAVKTAYGGHLAGHFELKGYIEWYNMHTPQAQALREGNNTREKDVLTSFTRSVLTQQSVVNLNCVQLLLSAQQADYLCHWQKGAYPIEVDLGFIESLKTKLISAK